MSIRKIKANKAEIEGDYVIVETYSQRPPTFLAAFFTLSIAYIFIFFQTFNLLIGILGVISISMLIAAFAPGRILRDIPLVDLVEIKRYQGKDKVTVVLDDERVKRNQQNKRA